MPTIPHPVSWVGKADTIELLSALLKADSIDAVLVSRVLPRGGFTDAHVVQLYNMLQSPPQWLATADSYTGTRVALARWSIFLGNPSVSSSVLPSTKTKPVQAFWMACERASRRAMLAAAAAAADGADAAGAALAPSTALVLRAADAANRPGEPQPQPQRAAAAEATSTASESAPPELTTRSGESGKIERLERQLEHEQARVSQPRSLSHPS